MAPHKRILMKSLTYLSVVLLVHEILYGCKLALLVFYRMDFYIGSTMLDLMSYQRAAYYS